MCEHSILVFNSVVSEKIELHKNGVVLVARQKELLRRFEKEAMFQMVGDKFVGLFVYLNLKQKKKDG